MPEKIVRGLWPHPPLKFSEVVRHFAQLRQSEKWFPHKWKPAVPGEAVWEGGVIERKARWLYIYRTQRHHPLDPTVFVKKSTRLFISPKAAAWYYLKWNFNLPGDLDGWKVER